jgi:general secretion pathway protein N
MAKWLRLIALALPWTTPASVLALGVGAAVAATSSRVDILSDDDARNSPDTIDVGTVRPIAKPGQAANKPVPRGNPLWAVPLSALTATEERPIFSASRRPPPRAVAAVAVEETAAPPPPKLAEAPPPLVLVGAVVGEGDAIAILMDRTDQKVIRMRQGESRAGWSLSSVQPREVTLKQGDRSEVLALQRLDLSPPSGPSGAASTPPGAGAKPVTPAAGNTSFAPFVPRSTPKAGESDGL